MAKQLVEASYPFCDDICIFRHSEISPGMFCSRGALENMKTIFGELAADNSEVPGDHSGIDQLNNDSETQFQAMFVGIIVKCANRVRDGGAPISVSDETNIHQ